MAHLLTDLANYFKLDEINIDNWTFKLYYKVSFIVCMTGTTVSIAVHQRSMMSIVLCGIMNFS